MKPVITMEGIVSQKLKTACIILAAKNLRVSWGAPKVSRNSCAHVLCSSTAQQSTWFG